MKPLQRKCGGAFRKADGTCAELYRGKVAAGALCEAVSRIGECAFSWLASVSERRPLVADGRAVLAPTKGCGSRDAFKPRLRPAHHLRVMRHARHSSSASDPPTIWAGSIGADEVMGYAMHSGSASDSATIRTDAIGGRRASGTRPYYSYGTGDAFGFWCSFSSKRPHAFMPAIAKQAGRIERPA